MINVDFLQFLSENLNMNTFFTILIDVLDIAFLWFIVYLLLRLVRRNVRMLQLVKGLLIIFIIKWISSTLGLVTIGYVIDLVMVWGVLAILIIFAPEFRSSLEQLGRNKLFSRHKALTLSEREQITSELIVAVEFLSTRKIGALITIEDNISLDPFINQAKRIDAQLTHELLETIFFPNTPLHDGAVIIRGSKILSAGVFYPTTNDTKIISKLGTRHRAALGISEISDSFTIVVSEETGSISIARDGVITYDITLQRLDNIIKSSFKPLHEELVVKDSPKTNEKKYKVKTRKRATKATGPEGVKKNEKSSKQ